LRQPVPTDTDLIDEARVRALLAEQFPEWSDLPVRPVAQPGWDNRSFRVGDELVARLPSAAAYSAQVQREHRWLPYLRPHLPLEVPQPVAVGQPGQGFPWSWSIYRWIDGDTAADLSPISPIQFAEDLGGFLFALHRVPALGGPEPGQSNFYRGAPLTIYDRQFRQGIKLLSAQFNQAGALAVWEAALATRWTAAPVWVHGDFALGNLIVRQGRLAAVIDFGQLCVGDPACDVAIAWTYLRTDARSAFRRSLGLDPGTWQRGRAWALWKAVIVAAGLTRTNAIEGRWSQQTILEIMSDAEHTDALVTPTCARPWSSTLGEE